MRIRTPRELGIVVRNERSRLDLSQDLAKQAGVSRSKPRSFRARGVSRLGTCRAPRFSECSGFRDLADSKNQSLAQSQHCSWCDPIDSWPYPLYPRATFLSCR